MFEAMIELIDQDRVEFTASYDNKGYLTIFDEDKEKTRKRRQQLKKTYEKKGLKGQALRAQIEEDMLTFQNVSTHTEDLSWAEERALTNIDALKEELVNIVRIRRKGSKDAFELCAEKQNKLNDDRAYVLAMSCYALHKEIHKQRLNAGKNVPSPKELARKLPIHKASLPTF